mmetsp:Transcript_20128/g.20491  ORF Transcript_20128/g.20491 Transcript_20128/m.20491 type:complete len:101 (-) Transcript_20128:225-527(-)
MYNKDMKDRRGRPKKRNVSYQLKRKITVPPRKKSKRLTTEKGSTLLWELDHQEDLTGNESRCEADLERQVVAAIKELAGEKEELAAVKEGRRLSTGRTPR